MNEKARIWFKKLSQEEKDLLIETLFYMDLYDFGIVSDAETGKYRRMNE